MKSPRLRVLLAGAFFFAWLGWLGYLAFSKPVPVVVSRSQLMVAQHFILAEIAVNDDKQPQSLEVLVAEDLRPVAGKNLAGTTIKVVNLREVRIGGAGDFSKAGKYLLPLTKLNNDTYEVTAPANSSGSEVLFPPRPWAYWWEAPSVAEQFRTLASQLP